MVRAQPTVAHVLLAMATTTAIAGALVALHAWWLAPAAAAAALSPVLEWRRVPPPLVRALPRLNGFVVAVAFAAAWLGPVASPVVERAPGTCGTLLAALAAAFALARRFRPETTLVPSLLGLMLVAAADAAPAGFGPSRVLAFREAGHNGFADVYLTLAVLVVASLWAATLAASGPAWRGRSPLLFAAPALAGGALALAGTLGLPLAQPSLRRAMRGALAPASTGLSDEATLGEFAHLARSRRRVLDLRASEGAGSAWLLRAAVLTRFDGRRWTRGPRRAAQPLAPSGPPPATLALVADVGSWFRPPDEGSGYGGQLRITPLSADRSLLLLPAALRAVTADARQLEFDPQGLVRPATGGSIGRYGTLLARARGARPALPSELAEALALPPTIDPRLRTLAARIGDGASGAAEVVARTLRHMRTGYAYTLDPGPFHPGSDPLAEFLFDRRRGYCEYFATATALLLRLQGVPARFVKGLAVGPHDDHGGGLFVVRERDAHAWVDAYVSGEGWREIDPTPPAGPAAGDGPGTLESVVERLRAAGSESWARLTGREWRSLPGAFSPAGVDRQRPVLFASLALATAALVASRRPPRLRRGARSAVQQAPLRAALLELERSWRAAGRARPASRGLLEHARRLSAERPAVVPDSVAQAGSELVALYYGARFGDAAAPTERVRELHAVLRQAGISRTRTRAAS